MLGKDVPSNNGESGSGLTPAERAFDAGTRANLNARRSNGENRNDSRMGSGGGSGLDTNFTREEMQRLEELRCMGDQSEFMIDPAQLEFARYLYERGKITEFPPASQNKPEGNLS